MIDNTYPKFIFEKMLSGMVLMILDCRAAESVGEFIYFYRKATSAEAQIFIVLKAST